MAVGDMLARLAHYEEALASYDRALRLAPGERDGVVGRARVLARAGRTDAAVLAYRRWLAGHAADVEAWRELGREETRAGRPELAAQALERAQTIAPDATTAGRLELARAAAAAALIPLFGGSHDSDANTTLRLGGTDALAADGPVRLLSAADRAAEGNGATTPGPRGRRLPRPW